ncbi:hypothetical protein IPdc08_00760 [archaeon]|nr:hypothetical protein IPdc08_00760 [archaeon]
MLQLCECFKLLLNLTLIVLSIEFDIIKRFILLDSKERLLLPLKTGNVV